ncbi:two-component system sensor histidine kinase YesM [Fontibacillus phaseoli]|uniref:histidine kinase n=1 Tax=Fontibacillus phaseoli TaxID=1416533 RepID=A0A369BC67_9BACL|nr:histidine kinase [Fontibacillus phaseoli]RCX18188.1 two-component system sensor histidine kinase YesM [Fontibacillus phaseoli]
MNKIRRFYLNHLKRKMFNKIILLYSAIMMILFLIAAVMVYEYQVQRIIREETDANLKTAHVLSIYLNRQYENIQNTVQQIYGDAALSDDLVYFLNNRYESYLSHRLNLFSRPGEQRIRSFSSLLKSYLEQNPGATGVTIYSYPKDFYMQIRPVSQQLKYETGSKAEWESWFVRRKIYAWDTIHQDARFWDSADSAQAGVYSYTRELQDPWTLEKMGMMMVEFDTKQLSAWLSTRTPEIRGRILVMSSQGTVIYDSHGAGGYFGQTYPYRMELDNTGKWVELDEMSKVNVLSVGNAELSVVGIVSKSSIHDSTVRLRNSLVIGTLLFIAASFVITSTVMRKYSKKIQRIIRSMSRIGEGDLSIRIQMPGEDELQQISERVNDMCERLELYIDKMYTSEIRQKHAELVALQSQIHPHFLYNTLESIRMKAYSSGAKDVGQMIYSLSVMFRSMVKKDTVVTVQEEIELCSIYLDLFRIRYEGRLSVEIGTDGEIGNCRIIKLLIQPIVENYIVHGFRSLDSDNEISLHTVQDNDRIAITVADNGKGIPAERLKEINRMLSASPSPQSAGGSGSSIGLINVHERIRMNYGDEYGVAVCSQEGKGTTVRIEIPLLREGFM